MSRPTLLPVLFLLACGSDGPVSEASPNSETPDLTAEASADPSPEPLAPAREAPRISPSPEGYQPAEMAMGWPMDPTCMERCVELGPDNQEEVGGAKVRASSSLKEGDRVYGPELAFDGDMSTAWCEGAAGLGVGEWLEIPLAHAEFSHVQIWPGYLKSDAHLVNNASPKRYRVSHEDWAFEVVDTTVRLDPERWPQHDFAGDYTDFTGTSGHVVQPVGVGQDSFALADGDAVGDVVRIQILEARPGKKHEDTCISEVLLTAITPAAG